MNVKIIIYSLLLFFVISSAGNIFQFFGTRRNNKLLDEYRNTVTELGTKLGEQEARNRELTELNNSITIRLNNSIIRAGEAEETLGNISTGLSGDITTIQEIITRIRSIRQALEEYYNTA